MDLYSFILTEHNGEQEHYHIKLVYAKTEQEAIASVKDFARHWYEDEEVSETGDCFEFFGGEIIVKVSLPHLTTEAEAKEDFFELALIGSRPTIPQERGRCPKCGSKWLFFRAADYSDGQSLRLPYLCLNCDFEGIEWHNIEFSSHSTADKQPITD